MRTSNMGYSAGGGIPGPVKNIYKKEKKVSDEYMLLPLMHRWHATRRCVHTVAMSIKGRSLPSRNKEERGQHRRMLAHTVRV